MSITQSFVRRLNISTYTETRKSPRDWPSIPPESSSHYVYTNIGIIDIVVTFTSDTRFGLVDLGQGWISFLRRVPKLSTYVEEILSSAHQSFEEQNKVYSLPYIIVN